MIKHIAFFCTFLLTFIISSAQTGHKISDITKVVILGTGNPNPDPEHSGPSTVIIVNDVPYLIDFGPGVVRRFGALTEKFGGKIKGIKVKELKTAFLTHLHSDHTTGYPDLILTPWVMGRDEALKVYGPEGIKNMTKHVLNAYNEDIKYRLYGLQPANNIGWRVNVNEIKQGLIYTDSNIKVEAFLVEHGTWPEAYGFRITTPDRTIVISGDTRPCENIFKYAKDADILIHEVYYKKGWNKYDQFWKDYHSANHTSTYELAELANKTNPGIIILYHTLYWGGTDQDIIDEIAEKYKGKVIVGKDLEIY